MGLIHFVGKLSVRDVREAVLRLAIAGLLCAGLGIGKPQITARAATAETAITLSGKRILESAPAAADFNGDGYKEIVVGGGDGRLYVVSFNGTRWSEVWSRQTNLDINAANPPNPNGENKIQSSPLIADLDLDGHLDIVIGVGGDIHLPKSERRNGGLLVYRYNSAWDFSLIVPLSGDGSRGWPQPRIDQVGAGSGYSFPDGIWDGIWTTPAAGDLDGDGDLEIVLAGIDRRIHAYHHDGSVVDGWPIYRYNGDALLRGGLSSPALGDLDGDGLPEVVVGTMSPPWEGEGGPAPNYNKGTVWGIDGDSSNLPGFPIVTEQYVHSSPALGDVDGDGELEIVVGVGWGTTGRENIVYAWNHDGTSLQNWPQETTGVMYAPPALGDIDGDDDLEIVSGCGNYFDLSSCNRLYAWEANGQRIFETQPPSPNPWTSDAFAMPYSPILADFDGDGTVEILVVHASAWGITIVEPDGSTSDSSSRYFYGGVRTSPLVDDVDDDGMLEIVAVGGETDAISSRAVIRIWHENGPVGPSELWSMPRHGSHRTGNVHFDLTPPQNPSVISLDHTPGAWSNDNRVTVNWSGASDDETGIARYYYAWDTSPATSLDTSASWAGRAVTVLESDVLSDGAGWYFHLRARNRGALLAEDTVHLGPFKIDTVPPASEASALPCAVWSTLVSWGGQDTGSGLANYDLQVRVGNGAAWTDWKSETTDTSDVYAGASGEVHYFRSLARDLAGNLEPAPIEPDAQTWIAEYGFSGTIYNVKGQPVWGAAIASTPPVLLPAFTDVSGDYLLCHEDPLAYTLAISRLGFGSLPGAQALSGTQSGLDFYLPAADDTIVNGQFERGDLSGWSTLALAGGGVLVTDTAHTGDYAVELSGAGPVTWSAALSQTVYVSTTLNDPTLSLMHRIDGTSLSGEPALVSVAGADLVLTRTLPTIDTAWLHSWMDLSTLRGQTATVTIQLQGPPEGSGWLAVDEVSLGTAAPGAWRLGLPMVLRAAQ